MRTANRVKSRASSVITVAALVASGLTVSALAAPAAFAAPGPIAASSVSADALPTAQMNGVAWTQQLVGDTVFVGGEFSSARPAGAALGTQEVPRYNLMSYDIKTGVMTNFAPNLNGAVRSLAVSPDGKTLYVGGTFTVVDRAQHYRLVAFDIATGKVKASFAPPVLDASVWSIVATGSTVYAGGAFNVAGGNPRNKLAAFAADTGALTGWAPSADARVRAMVATDDGGIVVGGEFANVDGKPGYGLAKVSQLDGSRMPWDPSYGGHTVRNAGKDSAITSLSTDGKSVFGTGYDFGGKPAVANLEGAFSADPVTGKLQWVENCHGDTYGIAPVAGAVFTVSHAHDCSVIDGFPDSDPRYINTRRALAFSPEATGTMNHELDTKNFYDWYGTPSPSLVHWFPVLDTGTKTGQLQAAWSVTGNSEYVTLAGEFPKVNGVGQQGMVRFAIRPIAPNKSAPQISGSKFNPTVSAGAAGEAKLSWMANTSMDEGNLQYQVVRNGRVVYDTHAVSTFWKRPEMGFTDTGLLPGVEYRYRLSAIDAYGNVAKSDTVVYTAPGVAAASVDQTDSGPATPAESAPATAPETAQPTAPETARPTAPETTDGVDTASDFTVTTSGLTATLRGPAAGGDIAGYAWDFGDGATGKQAAPQHRYAAAGTYPVTLVVTDKQGATASTTRDVTVTAPAPATAVRDANFTSAPAGPQVAFDATATAEALGAIGTYSWTFGDGTVEQTATATTNHTFAAPGTYTVELTATGADGAIHTARQLVVVTAS